MAYKNQTFKERVCCICGVEYIPSSAPQKYCSNKCVNSIWAEKSRQSRLDLLESLGKIKCQWCNDEFTPASIQSKFCSDKCRSTSKYHKGKKTKNESLEHWIKTGLADCSVCGSSFSPKNRLSKYCSIPCRRSGHSIAAKYRQNESGNGEGIRRSLYRKYREGNNRAVKNHRLRNWYGITIDQYEQMIKSQDGLCAICSKILDLGRGTHLDHWHSGDQRIRQVLCNFCNSGLGMFKEDKETMLKAVAYLEKHWNAYRDDVEAADSALEAALS